MNLKSFLQFLKRSKLYTIINLFGLAVSLMFVILIADYCSRMFLVDRSYSRSKDIYTIGMGDVSYSSSYFTATSLAEMLPEVEKKCSLVGNNATGYYGEKENNASFMYLLADSTFFDFFEYPFLYGSPEHAINSRDKAVITESLALKLFGKKNVVGEEIIVINENLFSSTSEEFPVTVSGVIKNVSKSILSPKTEMILLIKNSDRLGMLNYIGEDMKNMMISGNASLKTFYMVNEGTDLNDKLDLITEHYKENDLGYRFSSNKEIFITPLTKLMFDEHNNDCGLEKGNKSILIILLTAGIAILLFAVTNYINLTVAQTGNRAKEMACRRLLGESGKKVTLRLILEATLVTFAAFILGFLLALAFESKASDLVLFPLDIRGNLSAGMVGLYALFIVALGAVSGAIPAYSISQFKPIDIVKGSFRYRSKMFFSKVFIFFQYAVTIIMLICSGTVYLQIKHLKEAPLGHNVEGIIEMDGRLSGSQYVALRSELEAFPFVEKVGYSWMGAFFSNSRGMTTVTNRDGEEESIYTMHIDKSAIEILGLERIVDHHSAAPNAIYLTEAGAKLMGVSNEDTEFLMNKRWDKASVIGGIYKDFRLGSIMEEPAPLYMTIVDDRANEKEGFRIIYIKVNGDETEALTAVKEKYKEVTGKDSFQAMYGEEIISKMFENEDKILDIILIFTIIAVLISALGLFAISTYFTRQRVKEIGLRKIFGGTSSEILVKQLWTLITPLVASVVVAVPASYIIMNKWLQNYAYRMDQSVVLYLLAILFVVIIALVTVYGESAKAVNENPVNAIRVE